MPDPKPTDWLDRMDALDHKRLPTYTMDGDEFREFIRLFQDHARELIDAAKAMRAFELTLQEVRRPLTPLRFWSDLQPGERFDGEQFKLRNAPNVTIEIDGGEIIIREGGRVSNELAAAIPQHHLGRRIDFGLLADINHCIVQAIERRPPKPLTQIGISVNEAPKGPQVKP